MQITNKTTPMLLQNNRLYGQVTYSQKTTPHSSWVHRWDQKIVATVPENSSRYRAPPNARQLVTVT
jgi:hypothetical protein